MSFSGRRRPESAAVSGSKRPYSTFCSIFVYLCLNRRCVFGLYEQSAGTLTSLRIVDHAGNKKSLSPIQLAREAILGIESFIKHGDIRIVDKGEPSALVKVLRPYIDFSNNSDLIMELIVEGKLLGRLPDDKIGHSV